MGLDLNLGEVESWNLGGGGAMPDGWYVALVEDAEEGVTGNGNPKIDFTFKVAAGEYAGRERWDTLVILPPDPANDRKGNLGRVRAILEAMGRAIPKGNFVLDPASLKGARVGIKLETVEDEYQGETKVKHRVRGYKLASDVEVDEGLSLNPLWGATASPRPSAAPSTRTLDDDDIPF
jgi:hypothetical protein